MTDEIPPDEDNDDEVNETEPGEGAKPPRRVLSDAEFAVIREIYELGSKGIVELGLEFNVSRQTLRKRFAAAGVKRGSRAHEVAKAVQAGVLQASQAAGAAAAQEPPDRYADKRADWIEETRVAGYKSLKQAEMLARKTIADAMKTGAPLASADDNLKTVQRLNRVLKENFLARLHILRADDHIDEEDLPSLSIEDLTDEDILQHHKNIDAVDEDADIDALLDTVGAGDVDLELDTE